MVNQEAGKALLILEEILDDAFADRRVEDGDSVVVRRGGAVIRREERNGIVEFTVTERDVVRLRIVTMAGVPILMAGQPGPWLEELLSGEASFDPRGLSDTALSLALLGLVGWMGGPSRGQPDTLQHDCGPVRVTASWLEDHVVVIVHNGRNTAYAGALRPRDGGWEHRSGIRTRGRWIDRLKTRLPDPEMVQTAHFAAWNPRPTGSP